MKKQIIKTLIVLIIVISLFALSFSASAEGTAELMETYSGTCGDNLTWTLDTSTGVLTISGTGDMYDWGQSGDMMYAPWIDHYGEITSVSIGNGVTSIGSWAFCYHSFSSIVIRAGILRIGDHAFYECNPLQTVLIGYGVKTIEEGAFEGCRSLETINIPTSITSVGSRAFYGCSSLTKISLPSGVNSIADETFRSCNALSNVTLPDNLSSIGNNAFQDCRALESITLPDSVTRIETGAFAGCSSLTEITIPNGVQSIEDATFSTCSALESITLPSHITSIGERAFYNCTSLLGITIPNDVTNIGDRAFYGCDSLTGISIPENVTSIGDSAFSDCHALTSISVESGNLSFCSEDGVLFDRDKKKLILYPCGKTQSTYQIPKNVQTVGDGAFAGCGALTDIIIPEGVLSVESNAFFDCVSIQSITLPNTVQAIGSAAFKNCSALESIVLPNSLQSIENETFSGCNALTDIPYVEGLQSIGNSAFDGCSALRNIELPDGVTSIGSSAFNGCSALRNMELPDGVTSIGSSAFFGCIVLNNVNLPNSVTSIGSYAFVSCMAFTDITLPSSVTSVADYLFLGCTALRSVTLGDRVISIGDGAFYRCSSLPYIYIPDSTTNIGIKTFAGCSSLVCITLPDSVTSINETAFLACSNLRDVFFEGTEREWQALSTGSALNKAKLFTAEDYDESLKVNILTQEVPGGVAATMTKTGNGTIYYTLDGTSPCTVSIPYTGTFLLNEAGQHFINAIVIDPEKDTYGDVVTEYVDLEQSRVPEIFEQNSAVYMSAEMTNPGGIYYTFDLTTEPTTSSAKYENPIPLTETSTIRARVIETGKAPSEQMSYEFYVSSGVINYPHDSYSFTNTEDSFGYSSVYRIGEGRYGEIFGSAAGKFLYDIYKSKWGGSCFGMSATSLMFSRGVLSLGDYSSSAQTVNDLSAPRSRDSELTKLIERYQVAQFLPEMVKERNDFSSGGNMVISNISPEETGEALLHAVEKACTGEKPIVMILWKDGLNGSHAVVPYKLQNGQIYLYDCNRPNEENILSYTKNADGTYAFSYGEYSYAVSYNTLSTLLARLEGLQTGQVSLTADGKEQILISLNTKNFRILDAKGNEVTDYMTVHATEDMTQSAETVLYLDVGNYTILNLDNSLNNFTLSAATETDFNTVTVEDLYASIQVGVKYGHLSITATGENETAMTFHTFNALGLENEIELTADYVKIYACTDLAILVETTVSSITGNGEEIELTQNELNPEIYFGSVGQLIPTSAREAYDGSMEVRLNTDITELVEDTFTLTANVTGAGETAVVYAASYDAAGKMTAIHSWETQAGKTKYPFTIEAGTEEVKIYVLDKVTNEPLTESIVLNQGE